MNLIDLRFEDGTCRIRESKNKARYSVNCLFWG